MFWVGKFTIVLFGLFFYNGLLNFIPEVDGKPMYPVIFPIGVAVARGIGASGRPLLHFIQMSSKKAAEQAARHAGKGAPIKHASPSRGLPHFHPSDGAGNILKNGQHFTYPKSKGK